MGARILSWPRATRRRLFVWCPIAVVAGLMFLFTGHLANGASVLSGVVMVLAAMGAVLDEDTSTAGARSL